MKIHILGVCGTFMGGIAAIAVELGHEVSGSDQNVYPPMSNTLRDLGIHLYEGYESTPFEVKPDLVIIGNALSRGNPSIEYVLNKHIPYVSGPEWLAKTVLRERHVLAVCGTHGKTTTTAMLTWILTQAGRDPGYLIGGVAHDFKKTAQLGKAYFVIEADEYDTAFFDKRSKFMHYAPDTLIMSNLEFDHADIFPDLSAIQLQFQYLLRTVPSQGLVISPASDLALKQVIAKGCWSRQITFANTQAWHVRNESHHASHFDVYFQEDYQGTVSWSLLGRHNQLNALAAIVAAQEVGIAPAMACDALSRFQGVKRRLEKRATVNHITVYDDFAHHPTAIRESLFALRQAVGDAPIIAVLQFGSNTMKRGDHLEQLIPALTDANQIIFLQPDACDLTALMHTLGARAMCFGSVDAIVQYLGTNAQPGSHMLIMSNKGFDGIHEKLIQLLRINHNV